MKWTTLVCGCLAGMLAAADVAEPPRNDAAQQEIKEWFLENYYGRAPVGRPADMEFRGDEIWIGGGKVKIRLNVALPPGASRERPCPVVLVADRRSCFPTPIAPDKLKRILAVQDEFRRMATGRGYALVMWNVNDAAPDDWLYDRYVRMKPEQLPPNAWGVFGLYGGEPDGRKGDTWGTIRAWAWGHSRVMDWIESRPELDAKRVAVCGHSRLGKTALVAGVTDERFLVAYSNNSGVGGAHPHRLWKPGVCKLSFVNTRHLHWLCLNSRRFEADERNIPHDMDEFLALMAPRYLYVASASEDRWAGPEGEQFAAEMASRAWERMNLKGWGYRGHVGGHVRPGAHDFTPYDFKRFLDFCATPFGTAAGVGALIDLEAPVAEWHDGIPLGNGGAGALLWGGGDTLNVTLDRADFWHNVLPENCNSPEFTWETLVDTVTKKDDARRRRIFDKGDSPTKLPGVRLVMKLAPGLSIRRFRLDGESAAATVVVATPAGDREIVAWFDDSDTLLSMRVPDGVSFASKTFVKNPSFAKLGGYPEPQAEYGKAKVCYRRARRAGSGNRFDTDFEAGVRFRGTGDSPRSAFWKKFNAESSVSIPDADMQRMYDIAMYLYGAGARAGHPPLALQGLWTADDGKLPPWNGDYHNDLNTEMTYWAAGPAGRIEALEAFADFYIKRLPECRAFCRKIFKGGDGAVIPPTMGYAAQPILGWTAYTIPPIHGIWAFNTFCDAWDYDPTPAKAAKYLAFGRELAAGLEHSWKVVGGVRKLDISCSPEVGDNRSECFLNANSSYEVAVLDSFYVWLSRLADACGNKDEAVKWRGYVGTFGPPNATAGGVLEISAGNLLRSSHRHPSHLMHVFPLVNAPAGKGVDFARSVGHWEALGTDLWVGFSFPWAGCFEARLGRGDRAYRYLKDFQRAFTSRCGFNLNGDQLKCGLSRFTYKPFTLEANFGYARGIQEMLLSYDPSTGRYRLFPALPKAWDGKEVSFTNLRIPGGHRVSAKRAADGKVTHAVVPNPAAGSVPKITR